MNQKDMAIACLEKLNIYKPYIRKFKSSASLPCFFEHFAGFYVDQEEILYNKIKAIQDEYGCLVYAVTHEFLEGDEVWSMLCIPRDYDDTEEFVLNTDNPTQFYAFAYVWNTECSWFSEFGDIVVQSAAGGIKRIG